MKIALITDSHLGMRADSLPFNEYAFKFWENIFFPYIDNNKIDTIIHLGDLVDRRKYINFVILNSFRTRFLNRLKAKMYVIVGNHDVPYRNTNEVNAIQELIGHHPMVEILSEATTIDFDGLNIAIIPWINATNYNSTLEFIKKTTAFIAMGHLEIAGFEMDRGNISQTGMSREDFSKFETVYSGHFHHKSTDGHIFYLGNTYEMTWADYNDPRGFHVFDTDTREIEFIRNPYRMFHKVVYDDTNETLESVTAMDFSQLKSTMVKVVVAKKDNPVLFDHFMSALYKAEPLEVTIVENFTDYSELSESDVIDQADTTTEILDKYVDAIELGLDKSKLKNLLREIYIEAQTSESL